MRTKRCDESIMRGRLKQAVQFLTAADTIRELAERPSDISNVFVTNCVLAGIAAADAICCKALGEHARGESHDEAFQLIERVRPGGSDLANALRTLLQFKTQAGYGAETISDDAMKRADRAATKLVNAAKERVGGAA
jgi:hypothetical protein